MSFINDEQGVTLALVAVLLMAAVITLAFLLDVSVTLIERQRLQNAIELGVSAGGGIIAKAARAADLTNSTERERLQSGPLAAEARAATREYIEKNIRHYTIWNDLDIDTIAKITYPTEVNTCSASAESPDTLLTAEATIPHHFTFGELIKKMGGPDTISLTAAATYRIKICP